MTEAEEAAARAELLENVIATAQRLVKAEKDKSKITPAFIAEKVKKAADMFVGESPYEADQGKAVIALIQRFSHWMGKATTLKDIVNHRDWLNTARKKDWHYWRRYRDYLESKLSDTVVEGLDDATDEILKLLEDPQRTDDWDRRGLVVGHVQSGKTSNYSGLICKAADAGYKIIIVLAGMHNNLRSQTQTRLEESFLGYETTVDRDPGMPIGVAEFGEDLKTNSATTRAENGDFSKAIAKHFHGISPEERPWLFVVKKQKTVLTELLNWIKSRVADATAEDSRKLVTKLPLLMIDDEADNASVDTGEQLVDENGELNEEYQPKTINSLIRQILHAFSRKAYVGYTATPFANIFIHHKGATAKEGPDLFPKAFIVNLAAPSNYVGPARMFGKVTDDGREGALPLSHDIADHYDAESNSGWMPPKHNKMHVPAYNGVATVPPSLRTAIHSFVLACATRQLRGQAAEHSSMLVHVTRFVDVQNHVREQIEETVRRMRQNLTWGTDAHEMLAQMRKLWDEDFLPTRDAVAALSPPEDRPPPMPAWDDVLAILPEILGDIQVRSINGMASDVLDYATPGASLKVIAVGGDKLARGLTLEGLCVSYFVRTTKMYDTLMQMGRWFGYRPGYLDLCRLYTSPDLVQWFGHIADASEELREEFDFMAEAKLTPEQYGLKVKSHEVLTVTSPLKMRNAQEVSLTYSGSRPQTTLFHRDAKVHQRNLDTADALIESLADTDRLDGPHYLRDGVADSWSESASLWKGVDVSKILAFLDSYVTHPQATSAKSDLLAIFINKMVDRGQLKTWNVALLSGEGEGDAHSFPGMPPRADVYTIRKADIHVALEAGQSKGFSIGGLAVPKDEGIDLDNKVWREALELTRAARKRESTPNAPSAKGIREVKGKAGASAARGLLLLYPLTPYQYQEGSKGELILSDWSKPIMGFAIAFPACENPISVQYQVNLRYWEQEYGPSE
jgi:hypothetical protein